VSRLGLHWRNPRSERGFRIRVAQQFEAVRRVWWRGPIEDPCAQYCGLAAYGSHLVPDVGSCQNAAGLLNEAGGVLC
jgi:hypothetical protein